MKFDVLAPFRRRSAETETVEEPPTLAELKEGALADCQELGHHMVESTSHPGMFFCEQCATGFTLSPARQTRVHPKVKGRALEAECTGPWAPEAAGEVPEDAYNILNH